MATLGINYLSASEGGISFTIGTPEGEIGRRADTGEIVIRVDPRYFRPTEVDELLGDSSKAKKSRHIYLFHQDNT